MDDVCGIYKIQNLINNKIYIGKMGKRKASPSFLV